MDGLGSDGPPSSPQVHVQQVSPYGQGWECEERSDVIKMDRNAFINFHTQSINRWLGDNYVGRKGEDFLS